MIAKKTFWEKYKFLLNCWGIVFGLSVLVYLFYISSFYVGNHDYKYMRYGVGWGAGIWEGRFAQFILPWLLWAGQVLPILPALLAFAAFSLAAVLLSRWYNLPQKYFYTVIFSLLIVLNPYALTQLYYVHSIASVFCWPLFCVGGLMFIFKGRWFRLLGIFCLFFSIGGYAASFELALVLIIGKFLLDVLTVEKTDKAFWWRYLYAGVCVLVAALLYQAVIYGLKKAYIVSLGMYNVQVLSVKEILLKFVEKWQEPWRVLALGGVYRSTGMVWCLFGLSLSALFAAYCRRRLWWFVGCLIILVYALFTMAFMSPMDFFRIYRIHFFSVPYLAAILFAVAIIGGKQLHRNFSLFFAVCLVFCFAKADFGAQKVWGLGDRLDERTADRVRQDLFSAIDPQKHYRLLVHGGFYGREKMAGVTLLSDIEREYNREIYGYSKFLTHIFSSGLFLYANENPIWGDSLFVKDDVIYILSGNEMLKPQDNEPAIFFAAKEDVSAPMEYLDDMPFFPYTGYFFIGDKTIYLRLCEPKQIERF